MEDEPGATYGEVLLRDDEGNPLPQDRRHAGVDPTHPMVLESIRREFKSTSTRASTTSRWISSPTRR